MWMWIISRSWVIPWVGAIAGVMWGFARLVTPTYAQVDDDRQDWLKAQWGLRGVTFPPNEPPNDEALDRLRDSLPQAQESAPDQTFHAVVPRDYRNVTETDAA
jgi:hypothetical protein